MSGPCSQEQAEAKHERAERQLQAAGDSFIGWRIYELDGGYLAIPRYSYAIQAADLDDLVRQLRGGGGGKRSQPVTVRSW